MAMIGHFSFSSSFVEVCMCCIVWRSVGVCAVEACWVVCAVMCGGLGCLGCAWPILFPQQTYVGFTGGEFGGDGQSQLQRSGEREFRQFLGPGAYRCVHGKQYQLFVHRKVVCKGTGLSRVNQFEAFLCQVSQFQLRPIKDLVEEYTSVQLHIGLLVDAYDCSLHTTVSLRLLLWACT